MAYSDSLASRIRHALAGRRGVVEKKMFGGLGFLLRGNLLVCVWKQSLIVRLGKEAAEQAMQEPYVRDFDVTGKPMKGWVVVDPEGLDDEEELRRWIEDAWSFVAQLPAK